MDILSKTYLIQRAAKEFEVHWQVKGDAQVIQRSVTQGRCINPQVTTSPTVGVYPKELKLGPQSGSQRDTYTHIFMTALLLQSRYRCSSISQMTFGLKQHPSISWFLVYSQSCVTFTTVWFWNIFVTPERNVFPFPDTLFSHLQPLQPLTCLDWPFLVYRSTWCMFFYVWLISLNINMVSFWVFMIFFFYREWLY